MSDRIESWHQGHDSEALRDWLDQAVGEWFVNHVKTMDFITAAFIDARQTQG
jgi:hemerythrin